MPVNQWSNGALLFCVASCTSLLLGLPATGQAEQLPVRTYTTADGLPRDFVRRIVRDSHDFLWFCTADGLSRFNGYDFTTYGVEQGLPHPVINDVLETRRGVYWVATNGGGVCRFNPAAGPQRAAAGSASSWVAARFSVYQISDEPESNSVNDLYEDRAGQIWAGTDGGLFRLDETNGQVTFRRVELNLPVNIRGFWGVHTLVEDQQGSLWVSHWRRLVRLFPDGRTVHYTLQTSEFSHVASLFCDSEGRLWMGHTADGVTVLIPEPPSSITVAGEVITRRLAGLETHARSSNLSVRLPVKPGEACQYTTADGLASNFVEGQISQSSDGHIWIGTNGGLTEFSDGRFRSYTTAQGLSNKKVLSQVEDRDGNLWLGSPTGAMKITWSGFTSFGKADGLGNARITSIFENGRGELCLISKEGLVISEAGETFLNRFDGQRFTAIWPRFPREITNFGWGWNQITFQDHTGEWWVPTGQGLCRFPRAMTVEQLAHTRPKAVYTHRHGELPGDDVFRLFEDSRGDIWISISSTVRNALTRWERATESFHTYSEADGLPPFNPPHVYCEDGARNLWMGFNNGILARYRDRQFRFFTDSDGMPGGQIFAMCLDHARRLWVATTQGGVARVDDPQSDRPRFITYTVADGLSSNGVFCLAEDKLGRMYFGTGRGLDRLDLETKRIRHYSKADGLASNAVRVAFRDRHGALWFGTDLGLSRLVPGPDAPRSPPPILISGLRIAGDAQPISALGETEVSGLVLNPTQNQLSIDFVGLGFAAGEALKYQYRLAGGDEEWSAPTDQRTINYASLSPGRYQFLVRAVTADGDTSPAPATVTFTILPPIWQRWWFIMLVGTMVGLMLYALYRFRVARLIELERVRTRIATDLHDDIGSGLSQISILSEVVRRGVKTVDSSMSELLSQIGVASRGLVDSMSDIVWAIDPQKDHLSDLTQRMRRFASDLFTGRGIEFTFDEPEGNDDVAIATDVRRQLFLIFKESVTNIVRHSGCSQASVRFRMEHGELTLEVGDTGRGFDVTQESDGHGLASMEQRAEAMGGKLEVVSGNGNGTTITLRVPHRDRVRLARFFRR